MPTLRPAVRKKKKIPICWSTRSQRLNSLRPKLDILFYNEHALAKESHLKNQLISSSNTDRKLESSKFAKKERTKKESVSNPRTNVGTDACSPELFKNDVPDDTKTGDETTTSSVNALQSIGSVESASPDPGSNAKKKPVQKRRSVGVAKRAFSGLSKQDALMSLPKKTTTKKSRPKKKPVGLSKTQKSAGEDIPVSLPENGSKLSSTKKGRGKLEKNSSAVSDRLQILNEETSPGREAAANCSQNSVFSKFEDFFADSASKSCGKIDGKPKVDELCSLFDGFKIFGDVETKRQLRKRFPPMPQQIPKVSSAPHPASTIDDAPSSNCIAGNNSAEILDVRAIVKSVTAVQVKIPCWEPYVEGECWWEGFDKWSSP